MKVWIEPAQASAISRSLPVQDDVDICQKVSQLLSHPPPPFVRSTEFAQPHRLTALLYTCSVLVPLLSSAILWACNGEFNIPFLDCLFICVSAATGTGLSSVDLSSLTAFQQAILFVLEFIGNQAFVAWVVVIVRRQYFLNHLKHIVAAELERKSTYHESLEYASPSFLNRAALRRKTRAVSGDNESLDEGDASQLKTSSRESGGKIRPEMVRRVDVAPHLITPMGIQAHTDVDPSPSEAVVLQASGLDEERLPRLNSKRSAVRRPPSPNPQGRRLHEDDFGGFPGPRQLGSLILRKTFPGLHRKLRRTVTMPRAETLIPDTAHPSPDITAIHAKRVPYITFPAIVGRNSAFYGLTAENIEELGGVEYAALTALLWIVPLYYVGLLLISFAVIAPYMSLPRWRENFLPPMQHRKINPVWFSAFQVMGAWANTGMSLVDQNMVPFQTAYPMIIFLVICVLTGNTAIPVFLRFFIWTLTKVIPGKSRIKESLHFLLDHPRRCFIYMFPSSQTWLLLGILVLLNVIDWFFDIVLNIGNPVMDVIPVGTRLLLALLQAAAVRSAGFQPVPTAALVPAVQVLYVITMYIAIFPIAMGVRFTNVYEEKSLGIYSESNSNVDEENGAGESRVTIWGKYLMNHARIQLSFDMWWLGLSLFLLCVIERDGLMNVQNATWFNIFSLIFELVSAYGTVGLSLGVPNANYSFSGSLHQLSKLIIIAGMLRGRHRGLPVALDRAVLLPHEFLRAEQSLIEKDAHIHQESPMTQAPGTPGDAHEVMVEDISVTSESDRRSEGSTEHVSRAERPRQARGRLPLKLEA
ncbi:TrkH-domain-containing protein [Obba rivulosa]|uniref:Potassium transport protein n=1 Tax=Obba rivulosa TaxID=1052685 RepID=A0A8E2DP51_9APHY|nr:TrkH-domain-containing protein [Obba rivulosa]